MLYEVAFNLLAAVAILRWRDRVPVRGDLLKLYLLVDFTFRFLVEFVRGNQVEAFGLTGPQLVLIPMIAFLVVHFAREARRGAWHVPDPPTPSWQPGFIPPRPAPNAPPPSWRIT
jgi:prolipoprotein diacylglyceryltransferase